MVQKFLWNSKILPLQAPCGKLVVRNFFKIFYLNYQKVTYNIFSRFWMNFYENILLSKCRGIQGLVHSKVEGPKIQKWAVLKVPSHFIPCSLHFWSHFIPKRKIVFTTYHIPSYLESLHISSHFISGVTSYPRSLHTLGHFIVWSLHTLGHFILWVTFGLFILATSM